MEMTKEDFELFIQFKQFMATRRDMEPIQTNEVKHRREKGTGSITKLSGKRKRPYLASVTLGYDEWDGKQIQKPLAYFVERKQADKALDIYLLEKDGKCSSGTLIEYICAVDGSLPKEPISTVDLKTDNIKNSYFSNCPTFEEIWKKLLLNDLSHLSHRAIMNYTVSFNHFKDLHNRKIDTIKLNDIQPYFDELMEKGTGQSKMNNMKIVLNYIFKYGCKYDYIEKNYAEYIKFRETLSKEDKKNKKPFTKENIKLLFEHDEDIIVQSILVMIYTGMRPSELIQLKKENIHLEERYMIGGIKTKNGIDRIIPIHECIVGYIENIINVGLPKYYQHYLIKFNEIKNKLNFECTPHSGRHTFATLSNEYDLNEFLVKKIMGHSSRDLTKDVYTHVDTQRLIEEVNKIPVIK